MSRSTTQGRAINSLDVFAATAPREKLFYVAGSDFTHYYRLTRPDGRPGADTEILSFIDDYSRFVLRVTAPPAARSSGSGKP